MKKLFFILSIFALGLKGQDSLKKLQIGLDFGIGKNAIGRGNIYPSITLSKGNHVIFGGPAFIFGMDYNPYPPSYGVQAGYQFFPNGRNKRFNLFFEYDFNYVKANFIYKYAPKYSSSLVEADIELKSLDNYLGFGFRLKIYKGLYLKTNVGAGLIYYGEKIVMKYNDGTVHVEEYLNRIYGGHFQPFFYNSLNQQYYGGVYSTRFVGIFKATLGCDIYSFKKKKK